MEFIAFRPEKRPKSVLFQGRGGTNESRLRRCTAKVMRNAKSSMPATPRLSSKIRPRN